MQALSDHCRWYCAHLNDDISSRCGTPRRKVVDVNFYYFAIWINDLFTDRSRNVAMHDNQFSTLFDGIYSCVVATTINFGSKSANWPAQPLSSHGHFETNWNTALPMNAIIAVMIPQHGIKIWWVSVSLELTAVEIVRLTFGTIQQKLAHPIKYLRM